MGYGLLSRLLSANFDVHVFDTSRTAMDRAVERGAKGCENVSTAVRSTETVITMLPTSGIVEQVYLGAEGIRANTAEGNLCIDMSTIDPELAIRIGDAVAAVGGEFLDAPVSGATAKALDGTVTVMAGGSPDALERALPLFNAIGSGIFHVGPTGSGSAAKLANNLVACSSMMATAEAFQLGISYGITAETLTKILEHSSGDTWILRNLHPVGGIRPNAPSSREYAPGFSTALAVEMLKLISTTAATRQIPLTLVPALLQIWQLAANHGYADKDFASIFEFIQPPTQKERGIRPTMTGEC